MGQFFAKNYYLSLWIDYVWPRLIFHLFHQVREIKLRILLVVAALLLTGCTSDPLYWFKKGATPDDFRKDQTECEVIAVRDVPVRESSVPITGPNTNCTRGLLGGLTCSTNPGFSITSDDNSDLRKRAYMVCMERRGYKLTKKK